MRYQHLRWIDVVFIAPTILMIRTNCFKFCTLLWLIASLKMWSITIETLVGTNFRPLHLYKMHFCDDLELLCRSRLNFIEIFTQFRYLKLLTSTLETKNGQKNVNLVNDGGGVWFKTQTISCLQTHCVCNEGLLKVDLEQYLPMRKWNRYILTKQ